MTALSSQPVAQRREEQPYVAVRRRVTMQTIHEIADRLSDVFSWVGAHGLVPAGPPFFRYLVIDMERELEVEAGVPLSAAVAGEGDVLAGVLPAGRYVTCTHVGHPDDLEAVTGDLLAWAAAEGLSFDVEDSERGERWGCRLEIYLSDPAVEPDMNRWTTGLAFRLAD